MRSWIPTAVLAACVLVLTVVVVRQRAEVERLSETIGAVGDEDESAKGAEEAGPEGADDAVDGAGLARRVAVLERTLRETSERLALVETRQKLALQAKAAEGPDEEREEILSVVADEADRIFAKQLTWQRKNFMAARKPGFDAFVRHAQLTDSQREAVWRELEAEADEFVELLRAPNLREEPEALVKEALAVLAETDARVQEVLEPNQVEAYRRGRAIERATLMPWTTTGGG